MTFVTVAPRRAKDQPWGGGGETRKGVLDQLFCYSI